MSLALEELGRPLQRRDVGEALKHRLQRHAQVELQVSAKQARGDHLATGMHDVATRPVDALNLPTDAPVVRLDQLGGAGWCLDPLNEGRQVLPHIRLGRASCQHNRTLRRILQHGVELDV